MHAFAPLAEYWFAFSPALFCGERLFEQLGFRHVGDFLEAVEALGDQDVGDFLVDVELLVQEGRRSVVEIGKPLLETAKRRLGAQQRQTRPLEAPRKAQSGDVLVIDRDNPVTMRRGFEGHDTGVVGVVAANAGVVLGSTLGSLITITLVLTFLQ